MQASAWTTTNRQCQQFGQLPLTHPPHFNQTTSSNNGSNATYLSLLPVNQMALLVGHFTMSSFGTKQVSTQRQDFGTANNQLPASGHQGCYPNSTENASPLYTPNAKMNTVVRQQVNHAQKTPNPGNPQSTVCFNNYEPQGVHQSSHTENVTAQMNNSTVPSTTQAGYNTQASVQSHIYNQCSQQKALSLPSYSQAISGKNQYTVSSPVSSPQNVYAVSTQMNYCIPQTNYIWTGQATNAHFRNNTLTAVPVQRHCPNQELAQQHFINLNHNACSMQLPSSTCLSQNSNEQLHLNKRPAPPQTVKNVPTKDHSANLSASTKSVSYQKINDVPSVNLNAPLTQGAQMNKCDTAAAQASSGTVQISPNRALRAVAVVLPLSQENSPDDHPSPTDKPSPNASSKPCFSGNNQMKDAQLSTPEKSQQLTSSFSVSSKKAGVQNSSPSLCEMSKILDAAPKLSSLPLSFAQLLMGTPQTSPISGGCKQKIGNKKTPTEKKPSEEPLSSVPTTEWTLKMLKDKISEMENENKSDRSLRTLITTAGEAGLFHPTGFMKICMKLSLDTVVLSHVTSQTDLNKFHVLQHGEVYVDKIPYTSTWLNINSQLDDIDKEFGLPYFFKCTLFEDDDDNDTDNQSEQTQTVQTGIKSSKLVELLTQNDQSDGGIKSVDSKSNIDEEITALLQSETENRDENQCESSEHSSDSSCSFKIEVLRPEEAKVIFEQMDHNGSAPRSEETVPNEQNVPEKQTCNATTLEMICCIDKWKEKYLGLASEGECKCKVVPNQDKEPQSLKTDNGFSKEIFDLTEEVVSTAPLTAPGDTQEGSSPNSIISLSENEDESQVSEANQTCHSNSTNEQDVAKFTGSSLTASPDRNALQTLIVHERQVTTNETSCEMKEREEECRTEKEETVAKVAEKKQEPSTSPPVSSHDGAQKNVRKSIMGTSDASLLHPSKKCKISSHLRSQTLFESFSKCKNSAPGARIELTVFGSKQEICSPAGTRRGNILMDRSRQPPERIYVKMNSSTTSDTQSAESLSSSSVKRRIHENWRKSFPLPTIKIWRKNKNYFIVGDRTLKCKGVNSKRKANESDDGLCRKRRRTSTVSKSVTLLDKPKDVEEFEQENVLKFNVLPSSFSFEEGSKNSDSAVASTADEKTVAEKVKEKTQVLKMQGAWSGDSTNKSPTRSPTSSPESSSLFQEYQRRHKMNQKS
ncbi:uncharacterized protein si:ch211-106e7.2 isoform X2 [Periophthalmus magnuspinnatus]|nr:uncharacterized protein si:ch211-106e7.2 isoform X2 [Periophthalmus magnuspinnatus]